MISKKKRKQKAQYTVSESEWGGQTERRIDELEDQAIEIIQSEQKEIDLKINKWSLGNT